MMSVYLMDNDHERILNEDDLDRKVRGGYKLSDKKLKSRLIVCCVTLKEDANFSTVTKPSLLAVLTISCCLLFNLYLNFDSAYLLITGVVIIKFSKNLIRCYKFQYL